MDDPLTANYQKKLKKLQTEMIEKEKSIQLLQLEVEALKLAHNNSLNGKSTPHTNIESIEAATLTHANSLGPNVKASQPSDLPTIKE
jgi:FtsZ-binding cell division protein ZapB